MARIDFPEGPSPFAPIPLPQRKGEEGKKAGRGKGIFRSSLTKALDEKESAGELGESPAADYSNGAIGELLDGVPAVKETAKKLPYLAA